MPHCSISSVGLEHLVAIFGQDLCHQNARCGFVLHQKNNEASVRVIGTSGGGVHLLALVSFAIAWKIYRDSSALAYRASEREVASRLLHISINHRQAQASTLSQRFRREEGINGSRDYGRRHACAGVCDEERVKLAIRDAFGEAFGRCTGMIGQYAIGCLYVDLAAIGHSVPRIDYHVEKRVLELIRIAER